MQCSSDYSSAVGSFSIGFSAIDIPPPFVPPVPKQILSYLYWQYQDDDDLQAFVNAYNKVAKATSAWFSGLNLPIYTRQHGAFLDWVGTGLYGYPRPVLGGGVNQWKGPFNTWEFNSLAYNTIKLVTFGGTLVPIGAQRVIRVFKLISGSVYNFFAFNTQAFNSLRSTTTNVRVPLFGRQITYSLVDDDVYARCITWHFYKGDGKNTTVRWLKRRVARFLEGLCGTAPNIDNTNLISVTFGYGNQINIRLLTHTVRMTGGAVFNRFAFNQRAFNQRLLATKLLAAPYAMAQILKNAIDQAVLEMPFQYTVNVQVSSTRGTYELVN